MVDTGDSVDRAGTRSRRRLVSSAESSVRVVTASEVLDAGADSVFTFPPPATPVTFASGGGPVLSAPSIKPIFWGAEWGSASPPTDPNVILSAIGVIVSGPYLSSLGQYGITGTPVVQGPMFVLDSEPPNPSPGLGQLDGAVRGLLNRLIDDEQLPEPDENWRQFDVVFLASTVAPPPQPGGVVTAAHSSVQWQDYDLLDVDDDPVRYAWVCTVPFGGISALDMATSSFAHELVEAMTDPDVASGWRQVPDPGGTGGEIGDVCGQVGRMDGVAVQSYWSQVQGRCVIPTRDHRARITPPAISDATSAGGSGMVDVDAFCGLAPRWTGHYTYQVTDHTLTQTVQATTVGYTDPVGSWSIAGVPVSPGAGTVDPVLAVTHPAVTGAASQSQPVTLHYVASPTSLQVTNDPADGIFDVAIGYTVSERSDNLPAHLTASAATASLGFEGQTVQFPPEYYTARDSCSTGWRKLNDKGLQAVVDLVPKIDPGDPPEMDGELAAVYERRFAALADQFAGYARQIGRAGRP